MVRHGQSQWNLENRFTGWVDVPLSENGINEAVSAGRRLKEKGIVFDIAFTSVLKRAISTLWEIQKEMDLQWVNDEKSWRLNERHYGALQGLNKSETASKYGEEQVKIWRRSYDIRPPLLEESNSMNPKNDLRYSSVSKNELPLGECLKDTVNRVLPFYNQRIAPELREGKTPIICAHGNSIRALLKHLENISDEQIVNLEIPTGIPMVLELEEDTLKVQKRYYLATLQEIEESSNAAKNAGKAK